MTVSPDSARDGGSLEDLDVEDAFGHAPAADPSCGRDGAGLFDSDEDVDG